MRRSTLSCFQSFQCLADRCPDTCCAGWEIDLDEAVLKTYSALPGALGDEIRGAIREEDGYTFFACRDGRCPFLDEQNLCRLIRSCIGQKQPEDELLSEVCREHPRFHDCYGALTETSLSISCPEAARLLLQKQPAAVICEETEDGGEAEPDADLDAQLLRLLENARVQLMEIACAEEALPFEKRLAALMAAAAALQELVDSRQTEAGALRAAELSEAWLPDLREWLHTMEHMEFTDDRLQKLMSGSMPRQLPAYPVFPETLQLQLRNLLVYFLYRYLLRAVWDEDVLGKVGFAVRSVETIAYLAQTPEGAGEDTLREAAVRYSREVEHSNENLDLLYDEVWREYLGQ